MEVVSSVGMVLLIYCGLAVAQYVNENSSPINTKRDGNYITKQNEKTTEYMLKLEKLKPVVHVCCPPGLYFKNQKCNEKEHAAPALEFPDIYTDKLNRSSMTADDFNLAYLYPCADESYALVPGENEFYLLENGTVIEGNLNDPLTIDQNEYCLGQLASYEYSGTIIIVCYPPESDSRYSIQKYIYGIGSSMSAVCLAATFFVYAALPELRNQSGLIVITYVVTLMLGDIFLVVGIFGEVVNYGESTCYILAYIVHFSFLASFFWLNVMCFDIWWTFGGFRTLHGSVKQRERKKFIMYSIYAWGCATLLTMITMVMDLVPGIPDNIIRPEFGKGSCWFESKAARALYFYGPMGLTIVCNICLFIATAVKIIKHKKDTARQLKGSESRRHDDNKQWFNLYLKLFIVMGINWSMEIISWLFEGTFPKYVWYLTDLTNTLQGVIIFIIFVWKDKIRRLLMKRFGCDGDGLFRNSTSRSGCATSSTSARTTCISGAAPLQEKVNPYADTYARGKSTVTDDSDCI